MINIPIFIIATGFFIISNAYHGWNILPTDSVEVITDGITLLIYALSFK